MRLCLVCRAGASASICLCTWDIFASMHTHHKASIPVATSPSWSLVPQRGPPSPLPSVLGPPLPLLLHTTRFQAVRASSRGDLDAASVGAAAAQAGRRRPGVEGAATAATAAPGAKNDGAVRRIGAGGVAGGTSEESGKGGEESSQSLRSTVTADPSAVEEAGGRGAGGAHVEGLPGRLVDFSVDHVCLWLEGLIFVRSSGCTPCPLSLS
jgi:hypothetical protein